MPEVLETRLDNGMRVVSLEGGSETESDVVVVQMRLMTGSAFDGNLAGLAQFTSAMLTRGSAGKSLDTISEQLDALGASISVGPGRLTTSGSTKSLREVADQALEFLSNAVRQPDFPEQQIAIVRGQMLAGIRQSENSTRAVASRGFREQIYPTNHPFHSRSGGTLDTVQKISRDDLVRFHSVHLQPAGAIAAVAGGISHTGAVELIERHFGDWEGSAPGITIPRVTPPDELVRLDRTLPGKTQADIALGLPSIVRNHPDYYALSVANLILGRFGLYGRLGESVRERQGMAYYAYSRLNAGKEVGTWLANAGVAPHNIERAIESIIIEVRAFNESGPTEREFKDSIGSILGSLPLGLETSSSKASTAGDIIYHDLGHDYLQQYRGIIQRLNPEQITNAAKTHIDPERLVVSVAGPERSA